MLVLQNQQPTLWDCILPPELKQLPEELAKVDEWLNDDRFFAPYRQRFDTKIGRPTVPVQTYIRLMYLKFRYNLGYETLVQEVSDSIAWRRFCGISIDGKVPHSTTLIKLTKKYGDQIISELNKTLVQKAQEKKIIRGRKLQVDTTVVEADIHHPTDASLLADCQKTIVRTVNKIKSCGYSMRTKLRDRKRSIKKNILQITKVLNKRTNQKHEEVRTITETIARKVEATVAEGKKILLNAKQKLWRLKRDGQTVKRYSQNLIEKLENQLQLVHTIIEQSRKATAKEKIKNRIVSVFDIDARPIRRGKAKANTEFGYKIMLHEVENKIVSNYAVFQGNPSDDALLMDALDRHEQTLGLTPTAMATDRGFGSKDNEQKLKDKGVKRISLPYKGKKSAVRKAYEKQPWFRRLQRWRAGGEATISVLKRKYGLRRSLFRGTLGTKCWVGNSIFAYNLTRLARLSMN